MPSPSMYPISYIASPKRMLCIQNMINLRMRCRMSCSMQNFHLIYSMYVYMRMRLTGHKCRIYNGSFLRRNLLDFGPLWSARKTFVGPKMVRQTQDLKSARTCSRGKELAQSAPTKLQFTSNKMTLEKFYHPTSHLASSCLKIDFDEF